jgi:tRNA A-37 threonylcarbamoyl transferase component Bud32
VARLGRYLLERQLGEGGTSRAFLARKDGDPTPVVLKILLERLESQELPIRRFRREAHVASLLSHPNIARITDAGIEDGLFVVAMEYVPGRNLEEISARLAKNGQRLPPDVAIAVVRDLLRALEHAHAARGPEGEPLGLVHRDISPRNIVVAFSGRVKLIDFGLAHGDVDDLKTAPGVLVGTLRYMSPEQARGGEIDPTSDLYSTGVVLHELLSGRPLIDPKGARETLFEVVGAPAPPLSSFRLGFPPALDAVLERALEKDKALRFQTAGEFTRALLEAAGPLGRASEADVSAFLHAHFSEDEERGSELDEEALATDVVMKTRTAALDLANTQVPATVLIDRTARKRSRGRDPVRFIALGLGAVALALGCVALWLVDAGESIQPTAEVVRATPGVRQPELVPVAPVAPAASASPEIPKERRPAHEPRTAPRKVERVEPPPAPIVPSASPAPADPLAEPARLVRELRSEWSDEVLDRVVGLLQRRAKDAPAGVASKVGLELEAIGRIERHDKQLELLDRVVAELRAASKR